jgi:hypothetical protein
VTVAKRKVKAKDDREVVLRERAMARVDSLRPHPKNYREHGPDQLAHIAESLKSHGFYRNVVVSSDGFILAGHGVVQAAKSLGITDVPVVKLPVAHDSKLALKVLAGDNEIARGAVVDDRGLADILKQVATDPEDLLGTGFSQLELDRLLAIGDMVDPRAEWQGMPAFDQKDKRAHRQILVSFRSEKDAQKFAELIGQSITPTTRALWYPRAKVDRVADLRYVGKKEKAPAPRASVKRA